MPEMWCAYHKSKIHAKFNFLDYFTYIKSYNVQLQEQVSCYTLWAKFVQILVTVRGSKFHTKLYLDWKQRQVCNYFWTCELTVCPVQNHVYYRTFCISRELFCEIWEWFYALSYRENARWLPHQGFYAYITWPCDFLLFSSFFNGQHTTQATPPYTIPLYISGTISQEWAHTGLLSGFCSPRSNCMSMTPTWDSTNDRPLFYTAIQEECLS